MGAGDLGIRGGGGGEVKSDRKDWNKNIKN